MKLRLEISVAAQPVAVFEHDGPALHIGRDPACELALDQTFEGVSWRHARLDVTPNGILLNDLGSTNGTYVNDQRIGGPTRIMPGDAFRLGSRGPRLRLATPEQTDPTLTRPDSALAEQAAAPFQSSRKPGPIQPDSDPRPTMAGVLTPLRQKQTQPGLGARLLISFKERKLRWILIVVAVAALATAMVALILSGSLFRE